MRREEERDALLEALRGMVEQHCAGAGERLIDYGNPANRQALETLEKVGVVVRVETSFYLHWEWTG